MRGIASLFVLPMLTMPTRPPDWAGLSRQGEANTTVVETALFDKLLLVASAAYVFRHQYAAYFRRQAELAEQGYFSRRSRG